ncbi:hypothetical protein [Meridianimarinicoccus aquatilis]|uniref:Uncharacterized protein n=1 Tax=Meridianimarinicoccus aquatilis TaxID=2552766 RepID=A0A4R6AW95_9RHOB|nr:hypothetical protein [Fluviibacterium aquatile]TDL88022.1 hypothetical protein E2L05_09755 [Fluviibacterium aquatile]
MTLRILGVVLALAVTAGTASANCLGTGAFQTCSDSYGSTYTVNRLGNTTQMQGYNAQTGSSWSQQSTTMGNTTQHFGTTNGQNWNMQQTVTPYGQTYSGTNSQGGSFFKTCDSFGNCY